MADAFISYSRKDSEFGRRLHTALIGQGRDVWMDWKDIPQSAEWWGEIVSGIDLADNFVLLISPDSIASPICNLELDYARANNKRILPVIVRQTNEREALVDLVTRELNDFQKALVGKRDMLAMARDSWTTLQGLNWIFFGESDDFDAKLREVTDTLDLDIEYVHEHTRLLNRAKDWERRGRLPSLLLRDDDLIQAESWLQSSVEHKPTPTELHTAYIQASRQVQDEQQRITAAQVRRTRQLRTATMVAGLFGSLAILAAVTSFVVGAQAQDRANVAGTEVVNAQGTLTPIPATLTPVGATLTAAAVQIAYSADQVEAQNATAQRAEAEVVTAVSNLSTSQAQSTTVALRFIESVIQASTQSFIAAEAQDEAQAAQTQVANANATVSPIPATLSAAGEQVSIAGTAQAIAETRAANANATVSPIFATLVLVQGQVDAAGTSQAIAETQGAAAQALVGAAESTLNAAQSTLAVSNTQIAAAQNELLSLGERVSGATARITDILASNININFLANADFETIYSIEAEFLSIDPSYCPRLGGLALVQSALQEIGDKCTGMQRQSACYGGGNVDITLSANSNLAGVRRCLQPAGRSNCPV
jgi:hypothetical protein